MSWSLFLWGALLGPAWVGASVLIFRASARYVGGDASRTLNKIASRRYPFWAATGIPFGLWAGLAGNGWPDVGFTIYVALALVAPLGLLPRLRRAAQRDAESDAGCTSGGACTTCPIACERPDPEMMTA